MIFDFSTAKNWQPEFARERLYSLPLELGPVNERFPKVWLNWVKGLNQHGAGGGSRTPTRVTPRQILSLCRPTVIREETLININGSPDFSLSNNVIDYERFSFVTGEKQEADL